MHLLAGVGLYIGQGCVISHRLVEGSCLVVFYFITLAQGW